MLIKKYIITGFFMLASYALWATACTVYIPSVTNGQRCGAGQVTLVAISSASPPTIAPLSLKASPQVLPPGNTTYTTYWYYASSGGSYFATGSTQTFNLSSTTTYYVSTFSSAGCESARVPVTATITLVTAASAGSNQSICSLSGIAMAANSPVYGTGSWSVSGGPSTSSGQFSSTSNPTATFTPAGGSGNYTLTWTITNSSCSSSSSITVSVNQAPSTSNAGPDQMGSSTCDQTTISLAGNTPSSGSGMWTIANDSPNQSGSFSNKFSPSSTFHGSAGGNYTLAWTISNGSCTSYDDVNIRFNQNPTPSNAGATQTMCQSSIISMAANTPTAGTGAWSVVSGPNTSTAQFSNTASATSNFIPSTPGTYVLAWTISNGVCSPSTSTVTIQVSATPTANAGFNIGGSITCGQTSVTLAADAPNAGTGGWSIISGSGGSFSNSASPTSVFTGFAGTAYTIRWTVSNGPCTAAWDDMLVTFNRNPDVAYAGADISVCGQTSVTLAAGVVDGFGTGSWSVASGSSGSFSNASIASPTFTGTAGTTYTLRWTISNNPCPASSDDVIVTFGVPPSTANAGADITGAVTCGITSVSLSATSPTTGTGHWSIINGNGGAFSNASSASTNFTGTSGSTYTLRWTVNNGACSVSTDDVSVTFNQLPTVANAGPNQFICAQTSAVLAANVPTSGTGMWSISIDTPVPPGYHFTSKFDPHTQFSGTPGVVYGLVWTISNGTCSSISETTVSFGQQPTASYAGTDQVLCSGNTFAQLNANTPSIGAGSWTVTSGPNLATSQFSNVSSPSAKFTPTGAQGIYVLSWSISVPAPGCPVSTSSVIVNNLVPSVPVPTGNQLVFANDNPPFMQVIVPEGMQAQWYVNNHGGLPFSSAPSYQATSINDTYFFVSLKSLTTGCESPRSRIFRTQGSAANLSKVIQDVVRVEGKTTDEDVSQLTSTQRMRAISYTDGFGRPLQNIAINATSTGSDLIQAYEYDGNGHASKSYLPYARVTEGNFQEAYQADIYTFYSASADKVADDYYPFAMTSYEQSPLGRPLEVGGVGQKWQLGSHSKTMSYSYNTGATSNEAEEVRKLSSNGTSFNTFYPANTLSRTVMTDEAGHINIVFQDASGKTIVRKQQLDGTIKGIAVAYLQTYYLYDAMERLQYIIPPGGVAALQSNGWAMSTTITDQHFHQFLYDNRGRLIEKKTPGQGWTYYVYDKFNRVVLAQDGNQRVQNQWMFIKYDRQGRGVMSGLYQNTSQVSRETVQALVSGLYSTGVYYETRGTALHGYTNQSFPSTNASGTALTIYSVSYFDDYDFDNNGTADFSYDNTHLAGLPAATGKYIRGQATGSKKLILNTTTWLVSAVFYDNYGRVIQAQGNNHLNLTGTDKNSTVYDFEGKVVQGKATHTVAANTTTVLQTPVYDSQGRTSYIKHQINAQPEQIVAQYQYNTLGQVVMKQLHKKGDGSFLQNVDYRFDIRGLLTSINNAQLVSDGNTTNGDADDYFGMELLYDKQEAGLGNTAYYNGVISAVKWKNAGDEAGTSNGQRSYVFSYDKINQLTTAAFKKYGTAWNMEQNTLNETQTYDHNGNILSLVRNQSLHSLSGTSITITPQTIDNLAYTYANGNQLSKVVDASANATGFKDGVNQTTEYVYDPHGNVKQDHNRGASAITYNPLGKVQKITFSDGRVINYTYDASGSKLKVATTVNSVTTTIDYASNFTYTNGTLSYFPSPEGRVVKNGSSYEYQYAIADHQGNTRVVFSSAPVTAQSSATTLEEATNSDFQNYPTGGKHSAVSIYNHTPAGTYSQLLNGGNNAQVGLAKSYKVYPGDKVKIEAYAKYANLTSTSSNVSAFASALLNAFLLPAPAAGEIGTASSALNSWGSIVAAGGDGQSNAAPHVSVNIIVFDKNFNFADAAYEQIDAGAEQVGVSPLVAHDYLTKEYTVKEEGYVFMYIANENATQVDAYFDDVSMTYTPTRIVQSTEYYPFGLQTQNSWTRENVVGNNYLYNEGSELNSTTGLYDLPFRNYDASLGRFFQVDPLAHIDHSVSPFTYAGNNPINFNDPTGLLKATQQEFFDFIIDALNGGGGSWSDDSGPYLFSEGEAAAINSSLGAGGSGSYVTSNGNGTGSGLSWYTSGGQFVLTVSTGSIDNSGNSPGLYNGTMSTTAINIPNGSLRETADAFGSSQSGPKTDADILFNFLDGFGDNALNGGTVFYGTGEALYKNVNARKISYKLASPELKAGRIFQATKGTGSILSKVGKVAGGFGVGISVGVALYEFNSKTDNTHTWIDLGVTAAGLGAVAIFGTAAAPFIIGAGILYGGFVILGGEQWVDENFGYRPVDK